MKKFTVIFLFACLTLPLAGTFTWLHYQKRLVRKEVKKQLIAGIHREELVLLIFSRKEAANLNWEHDREFEFNDEMYDVVLMEIRGDSMYYWCWRDQEETQLNRQLAELVEKALNGHPETGKTQQRLLIFFKSLYHSGPPEWHAFINPIKKSSISHPDSFYIALSFPPPVPPPLFG